MMHLAENINVEEILPHTMIYLVGIKHEYQHDGSDRVDESAKRNFIAALENMIKECGVSLIAEEFSVQALKNSNATVSTARHIANKLNIKHLFCDPNDEERKNIGVPSREIIKSLLNIKGPVQINTQEYNLINEEARKYYSKREEFWFEKIMPHLGIVIIFLCGLDHLENFKSLLISKGTVPKVLEILH